MYDKLYFDFEGHSYWVKSEITRRDGDLVQLSDGRFLEIRTVGRYAPTVLKIAVVKGPSDISPYIEDRESVRPKISVEKGVGVWEAILVY